MSLDRSPGVRKAGGRFATTRWSVVLAAAQSRSGDSDRALAELCAEYWYPLYAYVRRRGHDPDAAQDLTQAFFAKLLEKDDLTKADPVRGRFRTFLLTSLKNFLAGEWRRARTLKRGGGMEILALDFDSAEERYGLEPAHHLDPEAVYERRWALALLERALGALRRRYEADGKVELFDALKGVLSRERDRLPYRELAARLGQTEGALRTAASRLRRRLRDELRGLIAETVHEAAEIDDELRHLQASLARTR